MIRADLSGKVVLVTGGGSGIGLAAARLFACCGAKVGVNHLPGDSRAGEALAAVAAEGGTVAAIPGNVAEPAAAETIVADVLDRFGRLDILINNAGTSGTVEPIPFEDLDAMSEAFWQTILQTNLIGAFRCARAAAPALRGMRGCVVNTASVAGLGRRGSSIAYGASKAALINLTQSLARALAPEVRVNAVAPGLVDTGWTRPWPEQRKRETIERTLLGRMATPDDIAEAMLYLAGGAAYVTGQVIVVDGGMQ